MMRTLFVWFWFSFITALAAQTPTDSLRIDSSIVAKPAKIGFFTKDYPSPRKALICSAILPGAGQAYNRQYWKIPLVYGAFGGSMFFFADRRTNYNKLKTEYIARVDKDPATVPDPELQNVSDPRIKQARDRFRSKSETAGLIVVVTYLLTAAEAYTGAHLKTFDVSDDLSLRVGATQHGVGVRLMVRP